MKITAIHAHVLRTPLATPFAFSQGWVTERAAVIVEVVTDAGLVGWGEALCVGLQPGDIAAAAIRSVLAPMLMPRANTLPFSKNSTLLVFAPISSSIEQPSSSP